MRLFKEALYRDYSNIGRLTVKRRSLNAPWELLETNHNWDFDNEKWIENRKEETLISSSIYSFGEDSTWVYVPPIQVKLTSKASTKTYELTPDDYALVGDGKYNNFTSDSPEEDSSVHNKISLILKTRISNLSEGDIYEVMFKYYNGSVNTMMLNFEAY